MELNNTGVHIEGVRCRVGSLEVSGWGVPRFSAIWNNPIGKSSVAILVPYTDEVEDWANGVARNQEEGYVQSFEYVFEDEDRTARLTFSGEGAVYPHLFGRNEIAIIAIVDIPYLHRKATEL